MNARRLLDRFLRYVKIDTTARPDAKGYPSSPGQLRLGRLLVREGKRTEAREQFQATLQLKPGYEPAIQQLRELQ